MRSHQAGLIQRREYHATSWATWRNLLIAGDHDLFVGRTSQEGKATTHATCAADTPPVPSKNNLHNFMP